ncbi:hypothetical protein MTYM_02197 [Methylococcales bacterium]|nr:hypothetical protein MTYM_02197 [Methylococcales bacterium]
MLSLNYNFVFVHIPKTAGNSIQNALKTYSDDKIVCLTSYQDGVERFEVISDLFNTNKHSTLAEYKNEYGNTLFEKLFKFTCVRNPWERAISYYFSPHRGQVKWSRHDFIGFINQIQPVSHYISIGDGHQPLIHAVNNIDYIIRFESLEMDFRKTCDMIGISATPLIVRNKSTREAYNKYYDNETRDMVCERFNEEIQYFGYSFNDA